MGSLRQVVIRPLMPLSTHSSSLSLCFRSIVLPLSVRGQLEVGCFSLGRFELAKVAVCERLSGLESISFSHFICHWTLNC